MNMLCLKLDLCSEDGCFQLLAEVQSNGFSGLGTSQFLAEDLLEFAAKLERGLIPRDAPAILEGGYWDREGGVLDTHLYLAAYPIDDGDGVGIKIRLKIAPHKYARSESQHTVQVELVTRYVDLEEFASQIRGMVSGRQTEAILRTLPSAESEREPTSC